MWCDLKTIQDIHYNLSLYLIFFFLLVGFDDDSLLSTDLQLIYLCLTKKHNIAIQTKLWADAMPYSDQKFQQHKKFKQVH